MHGLSLSGELVLGLRRGVRYVRAPVAALMVRRFRFLGTLHPATEETRRDDVVAALVGEIPPEPKSFGPPGGPAEGGGRGTDNKDITPP